MPFPAMISLLVSLIDPKFEILEDITEFLDYFEKMIVTSTFSTNYISIIIWAALCLSSIANFIFFVVAVYFFYFGRHINYPLQPAQNPDVNICCVFLPGKVVNIITTSPPTPPMHQPIHRPMHGPAYPSTKPPISPHQTYRHRDYMILLLDLKVCTLKHIK